MENNYLAKILPFLNEMEKDRREQFEQYFRTAPMWQRGRSLCRRESLRT